MFYEYCFLYTFIILYFHFFKEFKITSSECCPKQEPPKTSASPTDGPSGQITVTAEISTGTILSIVYVQLSFSNHCLNLTICLFV